MKVLPTLLFSMLAGLSAPAFAQWLWIDKDGHKVFSDRAPPADIADKDVLKRPRSHAILPKDEGGGAPAGVAAPAVTPGTPKTAGVDKELEARKKQAADAEAAKRKAEDDSIAKAKAENCARAKQAKSTLESGMRISRTNAAGEREFMDDGARTKELQRIQGIITSDCQ